jgi:hypothetical protein
MPELEHVLNFSTTLAEAMQIMGDKDHELFVLEDKPKKGQSYTFKWCLNRASVIEAYAEGHLGKTQLRELKKYLKQPIFLYEDETSLSKRLEVARQGRSLFILKDEADPKNLRICDIKYECTVGEVFVGLQYTKKSVALV